jgi:predicted  nucleic acid-binding Zn-ribbon protein
MQTEYYKILKEISSLLNNKDTLLTKTRSEKERVTKIQDHRQKRIQDLQNYNQRQKELSLEEQSIENNLAHQSQQLDQAKGHQMQVTDDQQLKALEHQISTLQENVSNLEEQGFELLEQMDEIHQQINDAQSFIDGSAETLQEITVEVNEACKQYQSEVEKLDFRIDHLLTELPDNFQAKIKTALGRKIPISIFTKINGDCCDFCKLQLNKTDLDQIEKKLTLTTCNGCKRIFIPRESLF